MLLLSRVIGRDVRASDGRVLGRVADVSARLDAHGGNVYVNRILLHRRTKPHLLVPWAIVTSGQHSGIQLNSDEASLATDSTTAALDADEILLGRDVLDTQIVDIADRRLARVADVMLAHRPDARMEVVGVEVGFGAVLRRLGLDRLVGRRHGDVVAWADLHLTSDRGHAVQLAMPRSAIHLLDARGLATLISRLDTESATEVLAVKEPEVAADVILASHPVVSERMLRAMGDTGAADLIAVMPPHRASHWRNVLATRPALRGRHFRRFRIWPRRRHAPLKTNL